MKIGSRPAACRTRSQLAPPATTAVAPPVTAQPIFAQYINLAIYIAYLSKGEFLTSNLSFLYIKV